MPLKALVVGICTYRRASVADAIRSIFVQTKKPDAIIIVDNDDAPSARNQILSLQGESDIRIDYRHVPGRNIAMARNACLKAAGKNRLAFLDDDGIADPFWLARIVEAMNPEIAAVFGPQIAQYSPSAPAWMRVLNPHSAGKWTLEGKLQAGSTGNCLIDLSHPAIAGHRFNDAFGPDGGTDTQFFFEAYAKGARYAFTEDARVHEPVPEARATWNWLVHRRYRYGHTFARVTKKTGISAASVAAAKLLYCLINAAVRADNPLAGRAAFLRAALHAGVTASALGLKKTPEYSD